MSEDESGARGGAHNVDFSDQDEDEKKMKEEKKFKCQVGGCGDRFVNSSNLRRYITKLHPEVKPYVRPKKKTYRCDRCGRVFPKNTGLKGHKGICRGIPKPAPARQYSLRRRVSYFIEIFRSENVHLMPTAPWDTCSLHRGN